MACVYTYIVFNTHVREPMWYYRICSLELKILSTFLILNQKCIIDIVQVQSYR